MLLPSHPLVQFKRGDHICLFYRDERMLVQTLAAYVAAGLNNGERCFCAQKPHMIPRILKALELLGVDADGHVASGALEIHSEDEVYFPGGKFEPQIMLDILERSIEDAIAAGFTGFRTAGEMSWALKDTRCQDGNCCDQLLNYEKLVQAAYPGKPAIGICQYPLGRFPSAVVASVLSAHRMALEETMAGSNHSTLTIRQGNYLADIITDRLNPGSAYHYVVQGQGSFDVLSWGVEPTMEQALSCSGSVMAELQPSQRARATPATESCPALLLGHCVQRAAVRQFRFQRHPEALPFAAAFRGHHQHERSFVLWNVFHAINDGESELID